MDSFAGQWTARGWTLTVALTVVVVLLLPPDAPAGVVALRYGPSELSFQATNGENNTLTVDARAPASGVPGALYYEVDLTDSTAPLQAGPGCVQLDTNAASCRHQDFAPALVVRLEDGDDSANFELALGFGARVDAGVGNDHVVLAGPAGYANTLVGGPGDDVLMGNDSDDELLGEGGRDELHGGGGFNYLTDGDQEGAVDADILDGGGRACLDYSSRTRAVHVDLADGAPDGERGEGDTVSGFSQLAGGRGDDRLAGTSAPEQFDGWGGADRMYGRGGNDIFGLHGREVVFGGPGKDEAGYFAPDSNPVGCGRGRPQFDGKGPWLSRSCEQLTRQTFSDCGAAVIRPPRAVEASPAGRLVFRIPCPSGDRCRERLNLTMGRPPFRRLASMRLAIRGKARRVALELPGAITRRARRQAVRLRVYLAGSDPCGGPWSVDWRFDIKLPAR